MSAPHVTAHWVPGPQNGTFTITLHGAEALPAGYRLAYTSQLRTQSGAIDGAVLEQVDGSFHLVAPLAPGPFTFTLSDLNFSPKHANDGVMSAFLVLPNGATQDILNAPLTTDNPPLDETQPPPPLAAPSLGVTPMPSEITLTGTTLAPRGFALGPDASAAMRGAFDSAAALYTMIFPNSSQIFGSGPTLISDSHADMPAESYRLRFTDTHIDVQAGRTGLLYALITLGQLAHHAAQNPALFTYPTAGSIITDTPRFGWRGAHLDVSRRFYPIADLRKFLAIMAWHKLNRFHWHLSDDEAWRIEIESLPQLTKVGASRGWGQALPPLLGDPAAGHSGFYNQDQVRALVAFAATLNIEIIPEIDLPAHSTAALRACPNLIDPNEPAGSYFSVHGFANNALNPGVPDTLGFAKTVLDEVMSMFPSKVIHCGGDEVASCAWENSPAAQELGLERTNMIQAAFMLQLQRHLTSHGRCFGGWDECTQAAKLDADSALIFAWQSKETAKKAAKSGYNVIFTPANAYYLDISQTDNWNDVGASWAGTTPVQKTYETEPADWVDDIKRLIGVQACIWSETLVSRSVFNHLVFPRLAAIAETAWSAPAQKSFARFAALSAYAPVL